MNLLKEAAVDLNSAALSIHLFVINSLIFFRWLRFFLAGFILFLFLLSCFFLWWLLSKRNCIVGQEIPHLVKKQSLFQEVKLVSGFQICAKLICIYIILGSLKGGSSM